MRFRYPGVKWYEACWLVILGALSALLLVTAASALAEQEYRATGITFSAFVAVVCITLLWVLLKIRGRLEGAPCRHTLQVGLALIALFTASLLIRSDFSIPDKEIKGSAVHQEYDATKQPGNELLRAMSKAVDTDVITYTIFDVCIGKVSHRIHRDGPVAEPRVEVTDRAVLTEKIKSDLFALGADAVGIAELDPQFVFSRDMNGNPVHLTHAWAIVIGMGLDYRLASPSAPLPWQDLYGSLPEELAAVLSGANIRRATEIPEETIEETKETLQFFSEGGALAVQLAEGIRELGYPARAHFHRWGEVQTVPLAIKAGLGELGKNGMVINETFGPRGSFAVVTTDLPLVPDTQVDLGIQEFCRVCNKCARACPVQAIPTGDPEIVGGLSKWPLDGEKCFDFIASNPKCLSCVGACPYNKEDYFIHRLAIDLISRKSVVANRLLVWLDDALGYGNRIMDFARSERDRLARADAIPEAGS